MAISFSHKLGFFEPAVQLELLIPVLNAKAKNSTITFPSRTTPKIHVAYRRQVSASLYTRKTNQLDVQELVDQLHVCARERSAGETKAIHCYALKSNYSDENILLLLNHVAHAYSKCLDFSAAKIVFNKMVRRNVFSWTVMIVGSSENGLYNNGFKHFCEMLDLGMWPDGFTYSAIIQTCIGLDCIELGKMVHAHAIIRGFASHVIVSTSLLNMYAKLGKVEDSCQVFNNMEEHNEVSWNAMISGLTANDLHLEAFNCFQRMNQEGFTPDVYTLVSVLKAVRNLGDTGKRLQICNYISELGMESNVVVGTALIDLYSHFGALDYASSVFYMNFSNCRMNMPWNAMISGYSQGKYSQEALELYIMMCKKDVKPDIYTFCSLFNAIADMKCLQLGRQIHGIALKSGNDLMALSVENAILDAYSKCGSLEDVRKIFDRMEQRDIISWTTLITAYSQCCECEEALATLSQMREQGYAPNDFTFASILVSCASLCILEYGQQVHGLLCKNGLDSERCIESALIDMYAKCGSINDAEKVFGSISYPDVVSWTAIVSAYAQHGFVAHALELFRRMELLAIEPNAVTFLCILFACSHRGMVEAGLQYFHYMETKYKINPEMEHYTCIVDILGRVGCLSDALEFIQKMPIEPNEMIWQTLLGACRIHGDVEIGEMAAKKILSVQPESSATYVLLSNAYIERGNYRGGLGLRNVMKEQGVKKEAGYSWISVKGRVHKFFARDQEHPQKEEIFVLLEQLREKIRAVGYVPDLRYALQCED